MIEGQIETITGDEMIRQPTQSISGIDGRPLTDCDGQCGGCTSHRPDELDADGGSGRCDDGDQDDPVLAAIREMELHPERADNGWANHIRTAYLANKQQPSDGWAFERELCAVVSRVELSFTDGRDLLEAHNADRAKDKQRIAELEEQLKKARR